MTARDGASGAARIVLACKGQDIAGSIEIDGRMVGTWVDNGLDRNAWLARGQRIDADTEAELVAKVAAALATEDRKLSGESE